MKCECKLPDGSKCGKEIEEPNKWLAYFANGKPVYWRRCKACFKDMWIKYKAELNGN